MKYALIGCGMICANHIRAALETGLEIVALCDLVEENREKALAMLPEEKSSARRGADPPQPQQSVL